MTMLTATETLTMLAYLGAGAIGDVFSQLELQQLFDDAGSNMNLAVYHGWLQIAANSVRWVNYRVAQTQVDRAVAFDHMLAMIRLWQDISMVASNQLISAGINPVPTVYKNRPGDAYPRPWSRNRSHSNWRDW